MYTSKFFSSIAGVLDTTDTVDFHSKNLYKFSKKLKRYIWDTQGPGETDSWNKLEALNLFSDSL